ncbi:GntR family transcriptional regulator [Halomonas sp. M5N1S17]|uniref:GntR family transcriptional regulator n=1 Tax=Halomonas alkalisoli TaxID=2907158 RepID=UPI001F2B44D9|nr:GntR family transcriptional regulator [Halomonas alkalisoli]MCE9663077.1 GntR family transcriptional regulator [Halomonas alkalisoli]
MEPIDDTLMEEGKGRARSGGASRAEMYKRLSTAISDHLLPTEARLPEEKLAKYFSTSRPKVREVLTLLARDKLVEIKPNRGAFVARPTVEQTRQMCEARMIIECAMARLAAERASADDIRSLRTIVEQEMACWDGDDYTGAIRCSREFHTKIAMMSNNTVLSEMLANILSRSALSQAYYAARGRSGCMCDDHFALLEAIAVGDADKAERLMSTHIGHIQAKMDLSEPDDVVDIEEALSNAI